MGLFSFLKNAGAKLFGKKAEANDAVKAAADEAAENASKVASLTAVINASGIEVEDLSIELNDDTAVIYGKVNSVSDKEKVVLMVGNTEDIATVDDRMSVEIEEPESDFYVVKSGDSLSKIAKEFYGDMMKYPIIFEANKPMLTDPDLIYPGQTLRIPKI